MHQSYGTLVGDFFDGLGEILAAPLRNRIRGQFNLGVRLGYSPGLPMSEFFRRGHHGISLAHDKHHFCLIRKSVHVHGTQYRNQCIALLTLILLTSPEKSHLLERYATKVSRE